MEDHNYKKLMGLARNLQTRNPSPLSDIYSHGGHGSADSDNNIWSDNYAQSEGYEGPYYSTPRPRFYDDSYQYDSAEYEAYQDFDAYTYEESQEDIDLSNTTLERKAHSMSPSPSPSPEKRKGEVVPAKVPDQSSSVTETESIPLENEENVAEDSPMVAESLAQDDMIKKFEAKVKKQAMKGEDMDPRFAGLANTMWNGMKEASAVSAILKKYPCPGNVTIEMVEINPEIEPPTYHLGKKRDNSLKQVQGAIARASYPLLKLTESVLKKQCDPDTLTDLCYDTLALMADANGKVLKVRRESIKSQVKPGYRSVLGITPTTDVSKYLFGPRLDQRIKGSVDGNRIRRGDGRHHPYARGRGYGEFKNRNDFENTYCHGNSPILASPILASECVTKNFKSLNVFSQRSRQQATNEKTPRGSHTRKNAQELDEHHNVSIFGYSNKWGDQFEAGRVSLCVEKWAELTSDHEILSDIRGYKLKFLQTPSQARPMPEIKFSPEEKVLVRAEINKLLANKVIVKVQHIEGEFVSNVFCREKKDKDKKRTILNLKNLNKFLVKTKFKMDTLMTTLALVTPGCFFNSFDFKDAYFSCAVFKPHRKYLRFLFDGQLYEFCVLPQGMSDAPRFYTKIMKVPLSKLREMGLTLSGYLDDQLHLNYISRETAIAEGVIAADMFQDTGNTINWDKSVIDGPQEIEHLGFVINSITMVVTMTKEKIEKILSLVHMIFEKRTIVIRVLAKLIGKIIATLPGNKFAKLMAANMEIMKNEALFRSSFDYDASVEINVFVRKDLLWITEELPFASAPVRYSEPQYVISTDASDQGFGMFDPQMDIRSGGRWGPDEFYLHINTLEVLACWYGLLSLTKDKENIHIRIMTDSTTALSCINKFGTTKSKRRNAIVREIWDYARGKNMWISACFVPGKENKEADQASREFDDTTEWTLRKDYFIEICRRFGKPTIDLFASRLNHQVSRYCAWEADVSAVYIDGLMYDWSREKLAYAFPPFSIIHKTIQKMIKQKAEIIMVVPYWRTQPWFALLDKLIIQRPILINVNNLELFLPFRTKRGEQTVSQRHPLAGKLQLLVAKCSGTSLDVMDSMTKSYRQCWEPEELLLTSSMTDI